MPNSEIAKESEQMSLKSGRRTFGKAVVAGLLGEPTVLSSIAQTARGQLPSDRRTRAGRSNAADPGMKLALMLRPDVSLILPGTCFGGNITRFGSTANIVALGMLEKRYRTSIHFLRWLKVGAVVGLVTGLIAWAGVAVLAPHMPTVEQRREKIKMHERSDSPDHAETNGHSPPAQQAAKR